MASYYRKFVKNFSTIATPITALLHKDKDFEWSEAQQKAFEELKEKLTSAPVLALPDPTKPFVVTTDASDFAIGAVLSQDQGHGDQPVAFESRKMSAAELNYPVHEKELLAIVHAIRLWRPYLEGQEFTVITDHASLEFIKSQHNLSRRQARWLETLQANPFTVKYRPGKTNVVADALSRPPQLTNISEIKTSLLDDKELMTGYQDDPYFKEIYEALQMPHTAPPKAISRAKNFTLMDGKIYLRKNLRLAIPSNTQTRFRILSEFHSTPTSGHLGTEKTFEKVARHYYWPKLGKDVRRFITGCDECQRNKANNLAPAGLLQPLETPSDRWEQITMDFIVQLPPTKAGFDAIVVFVDRYTKRAYFCSTHTSATAPETAKIFFATIFKNHGLPKAIISDRDAKFTSKFWRALFGQLGTKLSMSTAFHPQTDGQTERMNRTLEEMLRIHATYKQDTWDEYLPAAEFAYNNSKQASTGFTPFELDTGRHPNTPTSWAATTVKVAATADFMDHWNFMIQQAKDNLFEAQQRQRKYADQKHRYVEFEIGDQVLLSSKNILSPVDKLRPTLKLAPKFLGPFTIIDKISETAYKLDLPHTMKIHLVFHVSLLKKYINNGEQSAPPPPVIIDNEEEYEVEHVLDKRTIRNKVQYLIKWKGYPLHESTWEPLENLENATASVAQFESTRMSIPKEGRM